MPILKRYKTKYPGVYFIEGTSIEGKPERIFYFRYRKDGKQIEEKAGRQFQDDMTPAKASQIRALRISGDQASNQERRKAYRADRELQENRWTFNRLWNEYKERKPLSKSLKIDDNRYQTHIKPHFGEKEPHEISQFEIDKLRVTLLKTKKPQTVKHILAQIRRISNFAEKKNLCNGIQFYIEMPTVNNKKTEDLSTAQLQSLLEAIEQEHDNPASPMMKLALFSGMRRGEIFRLKWTDIDFERNFINIRDPKGGIDQKIPINNEARKLLESLPHTNITYVFPDENGKQRYQITREANRIKARAGLPIDFRPLHGLRHVYASMLASSGQVDMYTLQKLLTHKSPLMTQRYAHLRDDTLKRASNLMGELVNNAINGKHENKIVNLND